MINGMGWFEPSMLRTRRASHILLAALALDIFVVPPLTTMGVLPPWLGALGGTVTLLVAAVALGGTR